MLRSSGSSGRRSIWAGLLLVMVGLVALACSTGSYPVDVFTEMHYQQSYKSQEPPRLAPPPDAAPFAEARFPEDGTQLERLYPLTQAEALTMRNPVPKNTETVEHGRQIFLRNCSMCHGLEGRSDSFISVTFKSMGIKPPADFATAGSIAGTATAPEGSADGLAFWVVTDGLGNMPSFRYLLTHEERWTVIHYLRLLSEQANQ